MAKKIKRKIKSKSKIVFVPYEKAYDRGFEDMRHRESDIRKVRQLIGFQPKVEIDEILERIIGYFET